MSYIGNKITGFLGSGALTVTTSTVTVEDDALFSADGNTIIGNESSDTLTIKANTVAIPNNLNFDSNTFFLDASNNRVGIGTSSPVAPLHIFTSNSTVSRLVGTNANGTSFGIGNTTTGAAHLYIDGSNGDFAGADYVKLIQKNDLSGELSNVGANPLLFSTTNTERMRITSAGQVGIGTSSPNANLGFPIGNDIKISQVAGAAHQSGNAGSIGLTISDGGNHSGVFVNNSHDGTYSDQFITFNTAEGGISASTERMRITSSGNVGIGTSSPANKLEVSGAVVALGAATAYTNTGLYIQNKGSSVFDVGAWRLGASVAELSFSTDSGSDAAPAERMRIDSSGNVGIGTTSPSSALEVAGQVISTNSFKLTANVSTPSGNSMFRPASNTLAFATNSSERMRIDSSGNLLVGTTDTSPHNNSGATSGGIALHSDSYLSVGRSSGAAMFINRQSNDGDIIDFRKDGTTVGRVGAFSNSTSYCGASSGIYFNGANINPTTGDPTVRTDNANDIGQASQRFKDLYLGGGVYLGGTGSANKLDDYEEGTWTPTAGSNVAAISGANGHYTKVGNLVTITLEVNADPTSTSSNMAFGGLPFTVVNHLSSTNVGATGIAYEDNSFFVFWANETTNTFLIELDRPLQGSASSTSTNYRGTLTYFTS